MRRAWAIALVVLGAAGEARADVFVPDDPPTHKVGCVTVAEGLVAVGREVGDNRTIVDVSEGGGPWRRFARVGIALSCPSLAAAADGTALLGVEGRMFWRRPGGNFQELSPGRDVELEAVAAAPGGWAATIGYRVNARGNGIELVATIVAPDGASWSAVVERGRATRRAYQDFLAPRVAIDAQGRATAVWTRWSSGSGRSDLRTASSVDVRSWTQASTLATSRKSSSLDYGQVDVAVAPGGRTLLAWAAGRGVHASVDGGPAERLTTTRSAGSPAASIADDGAAVVAYSDRRWRVLANRRGPDGVWSEPRELAGADEGPLGYNEGGGPQQTELESAIAPDGRAVVAWTGYEGVGTRVLASSAAAGGAWTPPAQLSLPTRDGDSTVLWIGADGDPRALWLESQPPRSYVLRGARLIADAGSADAAAPVVTARLPARARRRDFSVSLSCSEACDVRLSLRTSGSELAARVRELAAGETATLRVRAPGFGRRARLELLVSDRAGNVTRLARRVTYRIH